MMLSDKTVVYGFYRTALLFCVCAEGGAGSMVAERLGWGYL